MTNSYLISLWRVLSPAQKTSFDGWVRSTHMNRKKSEDVLRLYKIMKDITVRNRKIDMKGLAKKLFGNTPADYKQLLHTNSYLIELLESFITTEVFKTNKAWRSLFLMKFFVTCGNKDLFDREWKTQKKLLTKPGSVDDDIENVMIEWQTHEMHLRTFEMRHQRHHDASLGKAMNSIDEIYMIQKLRYACEIVNRNKIVKEQVDLKALDKEVRALFENHEPKTTTARLYRDQYELVTNNISLTQLDELSKMLRERYDDISSHLNQMAWAYLSNFYFSKINDGDHSLLPKLTLALKFMHHKKLISPNHEMDPGFFKGMIRGVIMNGDLAFAEELIEGYAHLLPRSFRKVAHNYSRALIFIEQKKYEEANKLLNFSTPSGDGYYDIGIQLQHLKISYLLNDFLEIEQRGDAFTRLVNKAEVLEKRKETYLNFYRFIRRLSGATVSTSQLNKLNREVTEEKKIWEREWLLERIKEKLPASAKMRATKKQ